MIYLTTINTKALMKTLLFTNCVVYKFYRGNRCRYFKGLGKIYQGPFGPGGGCFTSVSQIFVLQKSYFLRDFKAETLYVCPKPCFWHTYKVRLKFSPSMMWFLAGSTLYSEGSFFRRFFSPKPFEMAMVWKTYGPKVLYSEVPLLRKLLCSEDSIFRKALHYMDSMLRRFCSPKFI